MQAVQSSPKGSKTFLLVVVLLITCYFADWTDDYNAYWMSTQYTALQSANGVKAPLSGGGMNSSTMLSAMSFRGVNAEKRQPSALETVFGAPLGPTQTASGQRSESAAQDSPFAPSARTMQNGLGDRGAGFSLSGSQPSGFSTGQQSGLSLRQGRSSSSPY